MITQELEEKRKAHLNKILTKDNKKSHNKKVKISNLGRKNQSQLLRKISKMNKKLEINQIIIAFKKVEYKNKIVRIIQIFKTLNFKNALLKVLKLREH